MNTVECERERQVETERQRESVCLRENTSRDT